MRKFFALRKAEGLKLIVQQERENKEKERTKIFITNGQIKNEKLELGRDS